MDENWGRPLGTILGSGLARALANLGSPEGLGMGELRAKGAEARERLGLLAPWKPKRRR